MVVNQPENHRNLEWQLNQKKDSVVPYPKELNYPPPPLNENILHILQVGGGGAIIEFHRIFCFCKKKCCLKKEKNMFLEKI